MAIFKCKMCGGDLEISEGLTVAECEYCGTKQTVPTLQNENLQNLFNRANTLRIKSEFDKAEKLYEKIIQADSTQSEAYWGLILCKYGIEYVDDPATFKKIPTCHRASYDSIVADDDYKSALENADPGQRAIYEAQAKEIDLIQKEILALAQKEENFDVFICYKETDADGKRTQDSVIANDIYHQLTNEGFKVFYAAITLEGKLGSAYEPIIFAALNSAQVMLSIGTKPEHFNAVWVKNEWSRFLKIVQKDRSKLLIPCYRDMDAYELPEEFAHLQAQDMSKIGFINDIVRGIKKVAKKNDDKETTAEKETVVTSIASNVAPLLKRAFMFLEDGEWDRADEFCEQVLNQDPENAQAYLGKLMAELHVKNQEELKNCAEPFDNSNNYKKAVRFTDEQLKAELAGYIEHINTRNENARIEGIYTRAKKAMSEATTESAYKEAAKLFESIGEYRDSAVLAKECYEAAEKEKKRFEDEKAKCNALLKEYIAAVRDGENIKDKIAVANNKIDALSREYNTLVRLKEDWNSIEDELSKLDEKSKAVSNEIAPLEDERSKLGLFAGKRKKEIAERISVLESEQQKISQNVALTQKKKNGYSSLAAVEGAAGGIAQQIETQKKIVEEASAVRSSRTVRRELSGMLQGEKLLRKCAVIGSDIISAGDDHAVGLKSDGTVVATGDNECEQCNVSDWRDIIAVSAGEYNTVGLKADGTVVSTSRRDVSGWRDIIAVSNGHCHTVGLKADGTVVATGHNIYGQCDVSDLRDIIAVSAGGWHTVGLKADGTVVATGDNKDRQCNVSGWRDIIAVSAGLYHTVGIKADGTVVATGVNTDGQRNVTGWRDIIAVSAGHRHTVGLKSDGTVVATVYEYNHGECDVSDWRDIIAVSAGQYYTVGLKADGTVVATGDNEKGQCNVSGWRLQTALDISLHPRLLSVMDRF